MKRAITLTLSALVGAVAFSGCDLLDGLFGKSDLPDLGIDWTEIQTRITQEKLTEFGWYVEDLEEEIEEFGTISFYNYDPSVENAFQNVEYQFYVQYGVGYEYQNEEIQYYDIPVYEIMLVDNNSDDYYACVHDEDFTLLNEEGVWFLEESKAEYVATVLEKCSFFVVGSDPA